MPDQDSVEGLLRDLVSRRRLVRHAVIGGASGLLVLIGGFALAGRLGALSVSGLAFGLGVGAFAGLDLPLSARTRPSFNFDDAERRWAQEQTEFDALKVRAKTDPLAAREYQRRLREMISEFRGLSQGGDSLAAIQALEAELRQVEAPRSEGAV